MSRALTVAALLVLLTPLCAQTAPPATPSTTSAPEKSLPACAKAASGDACAPTSSDRKEAEKHFKRGQKAQEKRDFQNAFDEFAMAARLAPDSFSYASSRES